MNILQEEYDQQQPTVGMATPEGRIQSIAVIVPGVYFVDTGAHGFLLLSHTLAKRLLSPQACKVGTRRGHWLFFEEDCAIAAPLFEQPNWREWSGWPSDSIYESEEILRKYFPAYFHVPVQLELPSGN